MKNTGYQIDEHFQSTTATVNNISSISRTRETKVGSDV